MNNSCVAENLPVLQFLNFCQVSLGVVELLLNRGQGLGRGGREERPPLFAVGEIKRYLAGIIVLLNVGPHLKEREGERD